VHRLLLFALAGVLAFSALSGLSRKRANALMAVAPAAARGPELVLESPAAVEQARSHDPVDDPGEGERQRGVVALPLVSVSSSAPNPRAESAPNRFLARGAGFTFELYEAEIFDGFDQLRFLLPNITNRVLSSSWQYAWKRGRLHGGDFFWLDAGPARRPGAEDRDDSLNESEREWIEQELMDIFASLGPEFPRSGVLLVRPLEARALSNLTEEQSWLWGASFEVTSVALGFVQWNARVTIRIQPLPQTSRAARGGPESR